MQQQVAGVYEVESADVVRIEVVDAAFDPFHRRPQRCLGTRERCARIPIDASSHQGLADRGWEIVRLEPIDVGGNARCPTSLQFERPETVTGADVEGALPLKVRWKPVVGDEWAMIVATGGCHPARELDGVVPPQAGDFTGDIAVGRRRIMGAAGGLGGLIEWLESHPEITLLEMEGWDPLGQDKSRARSSAWVGGRRTPTIQHSADPGECRGDLNRHL